MASSGLSRLATEETKLIPSILSSLNLDFSFSVPTDYFNTSYGTTTLALSKAPFTSHPSKRIGTLFLNPGVRLRLISGRLPVSDLPFPFRSRSFVSTGTWGVRERLHFPLEVDGAPQGSIRRRR